MWQGLIDAQPRMAGKLAPLFWQTGRAVYPPLEILGKRGLDTFRRHWKLA